MPPEPTAPLDLIAIHLEKHRRKMRRGPNLNQP